MARKRSHSKASNRPRGNDKADEDHGQAWQYPWTLFNLCAVLLWAFAAILLSSRVHFVFHYNVANPRVDPLVAFFLGTGAADVICGVLLLLWIWSCFRVKKLSLRPVVWLAVSSLPFWLAVLRMPLAEALPSPAYWEMLWLAGFSGFAFGYRIQEVLVAEPNFDRLKSLPLPGRVAVCGICSAACLWWYYQSVWYFDRFLLGFNDFGHFSQRLANTVAGRGLLMESPVLPAFWDHFNPGLLLLVPLWYVFPTPHMIFIIQALCLAGSGVLIWQLARQLGYNSAGAGAWMLAWLVHPSVGQMNIAFTYGWHPISVAIPLLLAALICLERKSYRCSAMFTLLAMSFEEGVVAVVACFALSVTLWSWLKPLPSAANDQKSAEANQAYGLETRVWAIAFGVTSILFCLIYLFSGIREFQTGRFIALGDSALEVIFSPIARPAAFWGELFQADKLWFVLTMGLPCGIVSLLTGWRTLIAVLPPLGLLLVWDHDPATCIAFQYASVLLPFMWLASMQGGRQGTREGGRERFKSASTGNQHALTALVTGLLLSLYVGGLPYSKLSFADVIGRTYGENDVYQRGPDEQLGKWLRTQLSSIRQDGGPALATGRIAAHLIGNEDVETVGQYAERRAQLAELNDRLGAPLSHYRWIVVDRQEQFQQSTEQLDQVLQEAAQSGFEVDAQQGPLLILRQPLP